MGSQVGAAVSARAKLLLQGIDSQEPLDLTLQVFGTMDHDVIAPDFLTGLHTNQRPIRFMKSMDFQEMIRLRRQLM